MRTYSYHLVDVFTATPFGGNPLAVFPEAGPTPRHPGLSDREMQLIAAELNLSETTFVFPSHKPPARFYLRFFTPIRELPLPGHPVIGTHFVLAHLGRYPLREPVTHLHQEVKAGVLPFDLMVKSSKVESVRMTQAPPQFLKKMDDLPRLARALGLRVEDILPEPLPQVVSTGLLQLMVPVKSREALSRMNLDRAALRKICDELDNDMAYLFALESFDPAAKTHARFASGHFDFEDPVTGSASGGMAAYLVNYGLMPSENGVAEWLHEQGHFMNRPGQVHITVNGKAGAVEKVQVAGSAVYMGHGELHLPDQVLE